MINYTIIWVSKTSTKAIKQLEDEYIKRIKRFAKINIIEIKESPSKNPIEKSEKEANDVFNKLPKNAHFILLDEIGKEFTSESFSKHIGKITVNGVNHIVFLIGGAYGHGSKIRKIANESLALSKMTFTHEMIRPFLLEQIYRLHQIERGTGYHH